MTKKVGPFKSWAEAHLYLGNYMSKGVRGYANTRVQRQADKDEAPIEVAHHSTVIVTYYIDGRIVLNSGGFRTNSTKLRLNQFTRCHVYGVNGVWFVSLGKIITPFKDGLSIYPDGAIEGSLTLDELAEQTKLRVEVKAYCDAWAEKFVDGKLKAPLTGDCFECQADAGILPANIIRRAAVVEGRIVAKLSSSVEHWRNHIKEGYHMGSLIVAAVKTTQVNHIYLAAAESFLRGSKAEPQSRQMFIDNFSKIVYRYLCGKLGL